MRSLRYPVSTCSLLTLLLAPCFGQPRDHELWPEWGSIVAAYNAQKIPEAKQRLERLLQEDPRFYRAHGLYWRAIGRTEDDDAKRQAVERSLPHFEAAPAEDRDERFYSTYIQGLEILGRSDEISGIKDEATSKFPRGNMAQHEMLEGARNSKDPAQAVEVYTNYLREFADHTNWADFAARDRFRVMHENPETVGDEELKAAAEDVEKFVSRSVSLRRNPYRYLRRMEMLVDAFRGKDPEAVLRYARKAVSFIAERWADTDEFDQEQQMSFWPAMLDAYVETERWEAALRLGQALVDAIDKGLVPEVALRRIDEPEIRRTYAEALRQAGQGASAEVQLQLASRPEELERHRAERARPTELPKQEQQPAYAFRLRNLDGNFVSLEDFRGKTAILSFWATWCGPCKPELEALQQAYGRYASEGVAILGISVDHEKSAVPAVVEEMGLEFPILYSDGSVEEPYQTSSIPQLYVIDDSGVIRFHRLGFIRHGLFQQQLDWMISAVAK